MRLQLVDRILDLEPGKKIVASKVLSLAEEYLQDHFPKRPVMPGVFMLQICVEAGMWLMYSEGKAPHGAVLTEVRNIRYGAFFEPGREMIAEVEVTAMEEGRWKFKAEGRVGYERTIQAKMILEPLKVVDANGKAMPVIADEVHRSLESRFALLKPAAKA